MMEPGHHHSLPTPVWSRRGFGSDPNRVDPTSLTGLSLVRVTRQGRDGSRTRCLRLMRPLWKPFHPSAAASLATHPNEGGTMNVTLGSLAAWVCAVCLILLVVQAY